VGRLAALAFLLLAACGSTRPIEVPPPFDRGGIVVTLRPYAHTDSILGFQTLHGTVENRTGRDVDLCLYLLLKDETDAVVGHAFVSEPGLLRGKKRSFEAYAEPGPPSVSWSKGFFADPPHYTKVSPGLAYDQNSFVGRALTFAWLCSGSGS